MAEKTQKIVINKSFVQFCLSPKGIKLLNELKGRQSHFYKPYKDSYAIYRRVQVENGEVEGGICVFKNIGDITDMFDSTDVGYYSDYNIDRNDPDLIKVVETLGDEANGDGARLKIVEIPEDVEWVIEDNEGLETIHEKHRKWI